MKSNKAAEVELPPLEVMPYRVSRCEFGLKDYHSPLAEAIAASSPKLLRPIVAPIARSVLGRFDPCILVEVTAEPRGDQLEINLIDAIPHGFRSMSATVFDIGARLDVHPVVEVSNYYEEACKHADGSSGTRACRDFFIRFDVEVAFNPGVSRRQVPVRLRLPAKGPCGSLIPTGAPTEGGAPTKSGAPAGD